MKKINIFLVDDHALFREGLRFLLQKIDFVDQILEAENGLEFLEHIIEIKDCIVLMDIEMPVMNGVEATRKALERDPDLKIIALSMYSEESYLSSMIEAGASGFLLKNSSFNEVKNALTDVMEGKNYYSPHIIQSILEIMTNKINNSGKDRDDITQREKDILYYICKGFSNAEIADKLSISKRTVDKHRENLLQKTQSRNTANLVTYAIKHHYFDI
ncbi:MAG: response regulator transcription factor [Bacteroidales bacterium]|jgi:DNA-binding NarL/FixJ family response regulator|nr:response regulator transcription factor [Bacteroidales bacterium]MDD3548879.1 response regulator transcription factor [Bacteroidales bacterium]MDD4065131.1 response regulator transcription factor [Bacteroidales bacterium]MDD5283139.1 response regulator transcription factor [Bacteroidales bacterium]MDY0239913.1 response regulator transcription factor [Bacteroidales bacterium]